ncbi:S1 RNA-binding protein [Philodulcilactobacillus myokoensis]|uniref:S1 RNA-binding protein n=1 Tax=Philodulcilactobacillus myokoensis TaxID=2929573 RepID=A0A9W6ESW8_9LACO|nr:S1-like domain-containing RNA-binding protein [Philodulcilactobacillus myokoensis]GLB46897.1 S1 RNA-binding protein [Philodulcilactobacillus myokoensis]
MENILGKIISGNVTDENEQNYYVQINGITFMLNKNEIKKPMKLGSHFTGFAYQNENKKYQITRNIPKVLFDHYAFGNVVQSKYDFGVFVNIGLPDKDIAVSMDDLPQKYSLWPKAGDHLMIALENDHKGRIWGKLADRDIFHAISLPANRHSMNKNVRATVIELKLGGTIVMTDQYHLGFIHPSEVENPLRMGEVVNGRVIGVHQNGSLNLSTKPRAYEAIDNDAEMVLAVLQHANHHQIPYTDKSKPEDIRTFFGISKAQFKRAVGHLLKQRLITESKSGIQLTDLGINKKI